MDDESPKELAAAENHPQASQLFVVGFPRYRLWQSTWLSQVGKSSVCRPSGFIAHQQQALCNIRFVPSPNWPGCCNFPLEESCPSLLPRSTLGAELATGKRGTGEQLYGLDLIYWLAINKLNPSLSAQAWKWWALLTPETRECEISSKIWTFVNPPMVIIPIRPGVALLVCSPIRGGYISILVPVEEHPTSE